MISKESGTWVIKAERYTGPPISDNCDLLLRSLTIEKKSTGTPLASKFFIAHQMILWRWIEKLTVVNSVDILVNELGRPRIIPSNASSASRFAIMGDCSITRLAIAAPRGLWVVPLSSYSWRGAGDGLWIRRWFGENRSIAGNGSGSKAWAGAKDGGSRVF